MNIIYKDRNVWCFVFDTLTSIITQIKLKLITSKADSICSPQETEMIKREKKEHQQMVMHQGDLLC